MKKIIVTISIIVLIVLGYFAYYRFINRITFEEYFSQRGYVLEELEVSNIDIIFTNPIEPKENVILNEDEQIKKFISELSDLELRRDRYYELSYQILKSAGNIDIESPSSSQLISFQLKDKDEVNYFNIIINFGRNIQINEIKIENGKRELKAFKVVGSFYEYELLE